jgi:hypothetical protein
LTAVLWQQSFGKSNEACVHVIGWDGSRYAIDVSARHEVPELLPTLQARRLFDQLWAVAAGAIMALFEQRCGSIT